MKLLNALFCFILLSSCKVGVVDQGKESDMKEEGQTQLNNKSIINLSEGKWQLIMVNGKKIDNDFEGAKIPFISFDSETMEVTGNTGCNNFFGSYTADSSTSKISMNDIASTEMYCEQVTYETEFLMAIQKADNFVIKDGVLSLNKAKMAPLAVFKLME